MPLNSESPRAQILSEAKDLICGDRNVQYGPPTADFDRIASLLNALGYQAGGGRPIESHDVAVIQICLKLSRLAWKSQKKDSWTDIIGYAACGWECVDGD